MIERLIVYAYEDVSFARHPSSQYAFELGNKHFNADGAPSHYDIKRAQLFYQKSLELDANHPMALQQLARTSFVRGNLNGALIQINMQLEKHPDSGPSVYYIRALIYGFQEKYEEAERDYRHYIVMAPDGWYAYNDLAWVLLKQNRPADALTEIDNGLALAMDNAWMLTTRATVLFELGRYREARDTAVRAAAAADKVTPEEWVAMYKGNDPASISGGIAQMQRANRDNLEKINAAIASSSPGKK